MNQSVNRPKHIGYLDFYRAIAIIAVVAIHATSTAVTHYAKNTFQQEFYYFWNQFFQFAVPAFLFLSSLVLFYNYNSKARDRGWVPAFYKKRLLYIFVPYLVWSFIYFVVKQVIAGKQPVDHLERFAGQLLTGTAHTHLYFFLIILQFYVIFPILLSLTRHAVFTKYMPLYFIAAQAVFYMIHLQVHFERMGSMLPSYFIVIGFGAWMGLNFEKALRILHSFRFVVLAALIAGGGIFIYGSSYVKIILEDMPFVTYALLFVFRNLFTLTACLLLMLICEQLGTRKIKHSSPLKVRAILNSLGTVAFGVFLIHPLVLLFWRREFTTVFASHFSMGIILSYLAALGLSWLLALGIRKVNWGWVLIGR
ncbi:acyltransferase [Paenibacillus xylanexedens]|uniref:acyltransferase n=1 Tax=Paenibacillus xylanexedens TaxID=528191 RepID=UPI00119CF3FF|nr:acyltransferase [Paenibacillus xylanexedens]